MEGVLFLTIKKEFFGKILKKEKKVEYRYNNKYYNSRIDGKPIKQVILRNGYAKNSPELKVKVEKIIIENSAIPEFTQCKKGQLTLDFEHYSIYLGDILEIKNVGDKFEG